MKVITIGSEKGGVGKTTTAAALGSGLALRGYRVLLIDLDPQANLSYALGSKAGAGLSSYELLQGAEPKEMIQELGEGLDLIAASRALAEADTAFTSTGREYKLREALEKLRAAYDFIIIDNKPALGVLTINSLTAADGLIIPAHASIFSLQGLGQLAEIVGAVKQYTNKGLEVLGILLTEFNPRTIISNDLSELIEDTAKLFDTKVFKTRIRRAVAVEEAHTTQQSIFNYAPKGNATLDYQAFIDELLNQLQE